MYSNNETALPLEGRFVKANESTTDLYSQTLHCGYRAFEGIRSYESKKQNAYSLLVREPLKQPHLD